MMGPASGLGQNTGTTCGAMILWWQEQLREEHSEYSPSLTNIPESAWRFRLNAESLLGRLSISCSICSYSEAPQSIFVPIMVLSSPSRLVRKCLKDLEVTTLFIEPGSPWENGYIESFKGKLRDELLNREIFTILTEAKILIEE